jgi:hypothetical protein
MQSDRISRVEERVYRHWYEDGLGELTGGGLFLLFAFYFGGHAWLEKGDSTGRLFLNGGLIVLLVGGVLATRWLLGVMKAHFTYPRTGYVELNSPERVSLNRAVTALVGIIGTVLVFLLAEMVGSYSWAPAAVGLLFGIVYLLIAIKAGGLRRFYFLSAFSVLLGFGLWFSQYLVTFNLALFYSILGLLSMISGGVTLARFLKEHPMPAELEDEQ